MIESYIEPGSQKVGEHIYGKSITDPCLGWEDSERLHQGLRHARFTAAKLAAVRKRGWSESVNEREEGVCSISAPIRNASGQVIAAISISGPSGRMGNSPGRRYAPLVMAAGKYLTDALLKASSVR